MILEQIDKEILALSKTAEKDLKDVFDNVDDIATYNSNKVLSAFIKNKVSYADFTDINGYGNFDTGRNKLESIFASVLGTEDALVKPQIMSGTNAIYLVLSALLKHGDTFISISGKPYDSLLEMIGLIGTSSQSLKANGVNYEEIDLIDSKFDKEKIKERLSKGNVKLVAIQRSRGYSSRNSIPIKDIAEVTKLVKEINKDIIVFVDNCYGELVEKREPGDVGVDIIAGSLMKNLGGGIANTGGYIAGRKDLVQMVAERLSAPGIGKELGANFNLNNSFFKGIFMAPNAVKSALKVAIFTSYMLEKMGFLGVKPRYNDYRTDIIQTIELETKDNLIAFTRSLQASSPIDSNVYIVPSSMPGYPFEEIMAAGCFTQGSTIELSADAPVIPPYTLFMQGSLTFEYGKLSILLALTRVKEIIKK